MVRDGKLLRQLGQTLKRSVAEADLLTLMRELANELRGGRGGQVDVRSASRLERDLGIDSLGRTELMLRIEQRFSIQLTVSAMGEVETVCDLLRILNQGKGARASASVPAITPALPEVQRGPPEEPERCSKC